MRATLIILLLSCGAAFCQDAPPESVADRMNDNIRQSVGNALKSFGPQQMQTRNHLIADRVVASSLLRVRRAAAPIAGACSVPLVNVVPPGTPVPMPDVAIPGTVDNMNIAVPAPACPSDFGAKP